MVPVRKAHDGGSVVLISLGDLNQEVIIDPVEPLLVVWRSAEEVDHANFILADEKFVKLLRGVGGGSTLEANILRKQSLRKKCGYDSQKQKESCASYHRPIIEGSG